MTESPLRVLLVDDNDGDRIAIGRCIRRQLPDSEVTATSTTREALRLLKEHTFDVALIEYELGETTALELLPHLQGIPTLVVTAKGNVRIAIEAMRRGAYDYLVKDHERAYLESLPSTIESVLSRKRTERALQDSETRYQDLYDNAPDMYFQVASNGYIISVNRRGADQLGYTVAELVGSPIDKVIHPADSERVHAQIARLMSSPGRIRRIEFRKVRKDGTTLHVAESMSVQHDKDKPPSIRILCRDITAQKEAEQRARLLQDRLARTERLESLGILAGGVAHDLNNILGPMVAYPDLLLDCFDPGSENYQITLDIKQSATRAASVIRDLLTMARRGRYELEPLNLNEVVEAYLTSAGHKDLVSSHPEVILERRLEADLSPIMGSDSNLNKVIMNLVMNAMEATPKGGRVIVATSHRASDKTFMGYERIPHGNFVMFEVADTGEGIAPKDLERIFEPFFTKKKMGRSGSGLGLAVVYGVVKDHRAFIDVRSQVGQGTSIVIYFPVADVTIEADVGLEPEAITGTERVLVVDDAPEQCAIAQKLLSGLGYDVETVNSGRTAIALLQAMKADGQPPFDLILLDMIMEKDFDGLDAYRAILEVYPAQPCVLVSGYAETSRVRLAQELGAGPYFPKPYTIEALGKMVRRVLDGAAEVADA